MRCETARGQHTASLGQPPRRTKIVASTETAEATEFGARPDQSVVKPGAAELEEDE